MRIEEVIGARIRKTRDELGLSQAQLGERLEPYTGRTWTRQAVSAAERGGREFVAAELLAFALALDVRPAWLMLPSEGVVELPGGYSVSAQDMVLMFLVPHDESAMSATSIAEVMEDIGKKMSAAMSGIASASEQVIAVYNGARALERANERRRQAQAKESE